MMTRCKISHPYRQAADSRAHQGAKVFLRQTSLLGN
jgi:hypothetical protein